jgi:hypothetical protein
MADDTPHTGRRLHIGGTIRAPGWVHALGKFRDTSELEFKGVRISLNMVAEKAA